MHKLVILIEPPDDPDLFEDRWPEFLHLVEAMPGLRREATSRVNSTLFGQTAYHMIHELFFDGMEQAEAALSSSTGQAAGRLLQVMTGGQMVLLFAEHREDDITRIQQYRQANRGAE